MKKKSQASNKNKQVESRRKGSIQRYFVSVRAIRNQILELRALTTQKESDFAAIIEVTSVNLELMNAEEQVTILNGYRTFLNSIDFPIQILSRSLPLDVLPYLLSMNAYARKISNPLLRRLSQNHIDFVLTMMRTRPLLDRKFYVIISDAETYPEASTDPLTAFFNRSKSKSKSKNTKSKQDQRMIMVFQRADKILAGLNRIGLSAKILAGKECAQVYYESFNTERAIRRPLTQSQLDGVDTPLTDLELPAQKTQTANSAKNTAANISRSDSQWHLPNLADLIAPSSIELGRDVLILEDRYMQTLAVTAYPRYLNAGWMSLLIELPEPMDISIHLHPQDTKLVMRKLTRRLSELESTARLNRSRGRIEDPGNMLGIHDIEELRSKLQRGDERFFASSLYFCVRAPNRDGLTERVNSLVNELDSLQIEVRPCVWEQDLGFLSCLPEARDRLLKTHSHDTSTITMGFPFITSSLSMSEGILYGSAPNGSPIIIDNFNPKLENANKVIFAKSGAGKSFGCKVEAMRNLIRGIDTYIIDPEDEYWPVADSVDGQVVRLSVGSPDRINPFMVTTDVVDSSVDVIAEKIQSLHLFFNLLLADRSTSGIIPLSQLETGLLDRCMKVLYQEAGITTDPTTFTRPMPIMKDLYDVICRGICGPDRTNLAERLLRYVDGSNTLFSERTNVKLEKPFIVFNIRDMDEEMRPLSLYLITEFIWGQIRNRTGKSRQLIIDEAWTLMQFKEGGQFLAGLARRARKYFLSLVTITQDVQDFLHDEHGRTVLANSSIKLLMKQDSTTIHVVSDAFKLSEPERRFLLGCDKGEGLLFIRDSRSGIFIEASEMEHKLATTDPREARRGSHTQQSVTPLSQE
jgi:TraG P-loop domain